MFFATLAEAREKRRNARTVHIILLSFTNFHSFTFHHRRGLYKMTIIAEQHDIRLPVMTMTAVVNVKCYVSNSREYIPSDILCEEKYYFCNFD